MTKIITITAPWGTGAGEIVRQVLDRLPQVQLIPMLTTEHRRHEHLDGQYDYLGGTTCPAVARSGTLAWEAQDGATRFGMYRYKLFEFCSSSDAVGILVLVPAAVRRLMYALGQTYDDAVSIIPLFLVPPSVETLRSRLLEQEEPADLVYARTTLERRWHANALASNISYRFLNSMAPEDRPRIVSEICGTAAESISAA